MPKPVNWRKQLIVWLSQEYQNQYICALDPICKPPAPQEKTQLETFKLDHLSCFLNSLSFGLMTLLNIYHKLNYLSAQHSLHKINITFSLSIMTSSPPVSSWCVYSCCGFFSPIRRALNRELLSAPASPSFGLISWYVMYDILVLPL